MPRKEVGFANIVLFMLCYSLLKKEVEGGREEILSGYPREHVYGITVSYKHF